MPHQPTFLFIGPDKTGSTWLYNLLRHHPLCFVPVAKDLYFFDRYYYKGFEWYLSFFEKADDTHRAIGELSHDYLFSDIAAARIAEHLPSVTLLSFLRHPAERTFSHYLYLLRNGITRSPFEIALEEHPELLRNSRYGEHLEIYFSKFSSEQLKVFFYDDLKSDARAFAQKVLAAIDLPMVHDYDFDKPVLAASKPRSPLAAKTMQKGARLARDLGFANLVGRVKSSLVRDMLFKPYEQNVKPLLDPDMRRTLIDIFEADITQVETLLNRPLDHWRV